MPLVLALTACASQRQVEQVQGWAIGRPLDALETCLGVPDHTDSRAETLWAQWSYTTAADSASIPFAGLALLPVTWPASLASSGSANLGTAGSCRVVATVRAGRVVALRYSGDKAGVAGPDALCAPLVSGCLADAEGRREAPPDGNASPPAGGDPGRRSSD